MPKINEVTSMTIELEIKQELDKGLKEIKANQEKLTENYKQTDTIIKNIDAESKDNKAALSDLKSKFQDQNKANAEQEKTIKDLVEKQSSFKSRVQQAKSIGQIASECKGIGQYSGGNMTLADNINTSLFSKSVTSGAASAGDIIEPDRVGMIKPKEMPLTIRDLLTTVSTNSNSVEWVKELVFTNNAAPQAGEGATKAESDVTFAKVNTPVQTIAHWIGASKQVVSDARGLQSMIDNKLVYGLKLNEDVQLLNGDGTGNNLSGLVTNATAYDVAGLATSGDTKIDQLRRAIYQAGLSYLPTTAIVLNPLDWMDLELHKTSDDAYLFANPFNQTQQRLWGRPVVESYNQTAGEFLLGAFSMAATLYDREQVSIRVAEQHASFFIQNMVAILCEERIALAVERPDALIEGTLAATA